MADCDANYVRLLKLFPEIGQQSEQNSERRIGIHQQNSQVLRLQVLEQTPYTTLVQLEQETPEGTEELAVSLWFGFPTLQLRLYHDARVAEVVSCEGSRRAFPRYEYPNERMYQQDEKAQWNQFLAEWLSFCLEHGYDIETTFGEA